VVVLGKFLFRYRNLLGPVLFVLALIVSARFTAFQAGSPLDAMLRVGGIGVAVVGELLRVVTIGYEYIVRGGRNRQVYADDLVQGGMFAHSRNPLYLGNILIAAGLALVVNAPVFYLLVLPPIVLAYCAIVAAEEEYLKAKFGAGYEAYSLRVNRWWPRLTGFRESTRGMRFNWQRVLVKEYNTTFVLVAALYGLQLWRSASLAGPSALPSAAAAVTALVVWAGSYLIVRALKKSGRVRDSQARPST
jgi:protein-S-isoprenylcysteine O-methyltransferase Ste14